MSLAMPWEIRRNWDLNLQQFPCLSFLGSAANEESWRQVRYRFLHQILRQVQNGMF